MRNPIRAGLLGLAAVCLVAPPAPLAAQELPPGPSFPIQSTFEASAPSGAYELVQLVLDFPPGAWTPSHSHGGQVFVTVLGGTISLRGAAGERTYTTGDTWTERPGEHHAAGNATGENVRVLVTSLLPKGVALTTADETGATSDLPPGPTLVYQTRTDGLAAGGPLDVVQLVGDFAPGAWTPPHEHGGRGVVTVLEGQIAVKDAAGERRFGPGESWVEGQGEVAAVGNPADDPGHLAASFALPKGAALTTVRDASAQMPAALPQTGAGGSQAPLVPALLFVAVAALALVGLGVSARAGRLTPGH